ncbi:MAG TPA: VOC family protein [Allosphingosinicella sp.]
MPSIQPTRIAQVAIPVHDLARAKHFYGERLGLAHLFDAPPGLSFFQCGETRLMLSQPEGPETAASSILYYAVAGAAEAQRALASHGIVFEEDARCIARVGARDVWLAVCRDSEGNLIGLMSEQSAAG